MNTVQKPILLWIYPLLFLIALAAIGSLIGQVAENRIDGNLGVGLGYFFPIYGGFWGLVIGILFSLHLKGDGRIAAAFCNAISWAGIWHAIVAAFVGGGAVTGALLFVVIGSLAGLDYSALEMLRNGAADGAFYLTIWSPGLALVLCIMRAYKRSNRSSSTS
ncbi:MAG: hypothetical protein JJU20_09710 [Opitutales bacterium]|nr:hypothetical protein [Opitutales bacterium]